MCLTNIPTQDIFKLLSVIYFLKYVHCDKQFLVIKISALLCFLNGFGIAIAVFSY